jgi:hypothetical protein
MSNYQLFKKLLRYSPHKHHEVEIRKMLEFLFVVVGGQIFQQSIEIPMGASSAPLLANLFSYSSEAEFIQKLPYKNTQLLEVTFKSIFRYSYATFYLLTTINSMHTLTSYTVPCLPCI